MLSPDQGLSRFFFFIFTYDIAKVMVGLFKQKLLSYQTICVHMLYVNTFYDYINVMPAYIFLQFCSLRQLNTNLDGSFSTAVS